MHLKGLIFDIDGTLVDSNDLHTRCWLEAFEKFGRHFDYDGMRHQMGKGGDLLVPDLLQAREMRSFGERLKKYRGELFKEKYIKEVKAFPHVREVFEALRKRGIKIALGSSGNPEEVEYYTRLLGVEELIEGSTSKEDAKHSKPSPEIFEAALETIGTDAARTMTVGDTPYDVLASHRVALPVIGVLCGGFERELLAKAEFIFASVEEIAANLDGIDAYFEDK